MKYQKQKKNKFIEFYFFRLLNFFDLYEPFLDTFRDVDRKIVAAIRRQIWQPLDFRLDP